MRIQNYCVVVIDQFVYTLSHGGSVCVLSDVCVRLCVNRSDVHCGSEVDDSNRHYIIQQETAAS